jgi:aminoglycoside phosphotransferase (APT) family kinase protein
VNAAKMPAAEVDITDALVDALLREQHRDLADLPRTRLANGWDNVIYRLGDPLDKRGDERDAVSYTVRLPRRAMAVPLIDHEQRWLPMLAPRLPLPIPTPIRVGRPNTDYPWRWSICRWYPGQPAEVTLPEPTRAARDLGAFVSALHTPAPQDAPTNPYRGVPLAERDTVTRDRIDQLRETIDSVLVTRTWDQLRDTPPWGGPPLWLHGDLHPLNILVHAGNISAVIDFGDITSGDPATDLSVAWMLFDDADRQTFRAACTTAADDDTWMRAKAWALAQAVTYLASSDDNPTMGRIGKRTLSAVLDDT